ncbi:unnamed protein product [Symbiodinium microadriaticum]|nr:unnamed protein product [Symbiodinium microadriaticum]
MMLDWEDVFEDMASFAEELYGVSASPAGPEVMNRVRQLPLFLHGQSLGGMICLGVGLRLQRSQKLDGIFRGAPPATGLGLHLFVKYSVEAWLHPLSSCLIPGGSTKQEQQVGEIAKEWHSGKTRRPAPSGVVLPTLVCFSGTSIFFLLVWSTAMFGSGSPTLGILFPFVYMVVAGICGLCAHFAGRLRASASSAVLCSLVARRFCHAWVTLSQVGADD